MAAPTDKKGSAEQPILTFPPLDEIIKEGNREIGRQVRDAVERAVTSGIAVDPARLRKWGPDGADYFAKKLRERIMPPPLPVVVKATEPSPSETKADQRDETEAPKSANLLRRSVPLIKTEKDWIHQEHGRWSIAIRAIARGLLVATMLLLAAILILRMPF
jgi:hypothetical protein